jgi:hypothetical protein
MNSVLTIGEYIMYLNQGNKLWEGDSKTYYKPLQLEEFVFSTTLSKLCGIILDNFILTVTGLTPQQRGVITYHFHIHGIPHNRSCFLHS